MKLFFTLLLVASTLLSTVSSRPPRLVARKPTQGLASRDSNGLQNVVTWDEHSILINGERIMVFSGEFHPWRLPVTSLWPDIFEKVKALGFQAVSFYVHWGLVEYKRGVFDFDSYRSYEPFFQAAKDSGIYLIARPGPYINAETTGGGFPGWGTRVPGAWRSNNQTYLDAIKPYVQKISEIIAPHQITNGGPVILLQPENEFSDHTDIPWPQSQYMQTLEDWFRDGGIVVPLISNSVSIDLADYAPGSGEGEVDIFGYDSYPLGFDCANAYTWPDNAFPTSFFEAHLAASASGPNAIQEFQGGAFDPYGGPGYNACAILLNNEFERVFYKALFSYATTSLNLYMIYGGTNWGGLAEPSVYTSYDYGAAITEYRTIEREKYSELKLEAQFLKASPAFLTSVPQNLIPDTINGSAFSTNPSLAVTQSVDVVGNKTVFYTVRHAAYNTLDTANYKLQLPTSIGNITIPRLLSNETLTLGGRDSKIHVTGYSMGELSIVYSSGEIFTWKSFGKKTVVVLYGSPGEIHETMFASVEGSSVRAVSGEGLLKSTVTKTTATIAYKTLGTTVVQIGNDLVVYLLDRNTAYTFWVPDLPSGNDSTYSTEKSVIVKGPYLVRNASTVGSVLRLTGDLNATTPFEIFADASIHQVEFNGRKLNMEKTAYGSLNGTLSFSEPSIVLPTLEKLEWKAVNSLPEISSDYDDSRWTTADHKTTNNPRKLTTPTSLYSSDYGYHTGNLLWRGHFTATGSETAFNISVQGGTGFGFSVWLNSNFLGSFAGYDAGAFGNKTLPISLKAGSKNVFTILQDNSGLEEDFTAGSDSFKTPRGILYYDFHGSSNTSVSWKVTGNLGGEDYIDKVRGPYNEGGLFAERQGFHLPGAPTANWTASSPYDGIDEASVAFYKTSFNLSLPTSYDIPLGFRFTNCSSPGEDFRAQIYVNGYQYGKYENNIGPQRDFPVPEGILNYQGSNSLGVSLWAMDSAGARLCGLELIAHAIVEASLGRIAATAQPEWVKRDEAY